VSYAFERPSSLQLIPKYLRYLRLIVSPPQFCCDRFRRQRFNRICATKSFSQGEPIMTLERIICTLSFGLVVLAADSSAQIVPADYHRPLCADKFSAKSLRIAAEESICLFHIVHARRPADLVVIRWSSVSGCMNSARFRPSEQKSAQLRMRCEVYSAL
jgi:hypothetical protein